MSCLRNSFRKSSRCQPLEANSNPPFVPPFLKGKFSLGTRIESLRRQYTDASSVGGVIACTLSQPPVAEDLTEKNAPGFRRRRVFVHCQFFLFFIVLTWTNGRRSKQQWKFLGARQHELIEGRLSFCRKGLKETSRTQGRK